MAGHIESGVTVDEFLSDDEQAEIVKRWWRENGLFVALGVVVGLGGLFGWQSWRDANAIAAEEASSVYQELAEAISGDRLNQAREILTILETDYSGTPYVSQAWLQFAKVSMDQNDPDAAVDALEKVVSGDDEQLQQVARLRIAQIHLYQEDYEAALKVLAATKSEAFAPLYSDMRGDVYFAMGNFAAAASAYQEVLDSDESAVVNRPYIQVKLDSLPATDPEPANEAVDVAPGVDEALQNSESGADEPEV
jgi:predicted negative regulator of RcsB-dependent stress response